MHNFSLELGSVLVNMSAAFSSVEILAILCWLDTLVGDSPLWTSCEPAASSDKLSWSSLVGWDLHLNLSVLCGLLQKRHFLLPENHIFIDNHFVVSRLCTPKPISFHSLLITQHNTFDGPGLQFSLPHMSIALHPNTLSLLVSLRPIPSHIWYIKIQSRWRTFIYQYYSCGCSFSPEALWHTRSKQQTSQPF